MSLFQRLRALLFIVTLVGMTFLPSARAQIPPLPPSAITTEELIQMYQATWSDPGQWTALKRLIITGTKDPQKFIPSLREALKRSEKDVVANAAFLTHLWSVSDQLTEELRKALPKTDIYRYEPYLEYVYVALGAHGDSSEVFVSTTKKFLKSLDPNLVRLALQHVSVAVSNPDDPLIETAVNFLQSAEKVEKVIGRPPLSHFAAEGLDHLALRGPAFENRINELVREKYVGKGSSKEPCTILCEITQHSTQWMNSNAVDRYGLGTEAVPTYELAVLALQGSFLLKAAKHCRVPKDLVARLEKILVQLNPTPPPCQTPSEIDQLTNHFSNLGNLIESHYTHPNPNVVWSSAKVYANQYTLLLIDTLISSGGEKEILIPLKNRVLLETNQDLSEALELKENAPAHGGSAYNTYGLSTTLLTLDSPPPRLIEAMSAVSKKINQRGGDPNAVPYYPSILSKQRSTRDSAGRSIPFYLALAKHSENKEDRETYREYSLQGIEKFLNVRETLTTHLVRPHVGPSHHVGPDNIAPFFLYPMLPFAAQAIRHLEQVGDESLKPRITVARAHLIEAIQLLYLEKKGAFAKQGGASEQNDYAGSASYNTALAGLALVELLDGEKCEK